MSARICTRSFASRFESGSSIRKTLARADDRAAHRDALALAAGELAGLALEVLGEPEQLRHLGDAPLALALLHARDLEREADVRRDGEVRVERVVLEHHRDVALLRRVVRHVAVADQDRAGVDLLEPREHAQRGRLARARRADEHDELAVLDVQVERVDGRRRRPRIDARRLVEADVSHRCTSERFAGALRGRRAQLAAQACMRRRGGAERVEREQRSADDRRGRSTTIVARESASSERPASIAASRPGSPRLQEPAAEHDLDRLLAPGRAASGRRARARRSPTPSRSTIPAATASAAASANTSGASSTTRRSEIAPDVHRPPRARAAFEPEVRRHGALERRAAGRGRPRCARRRRPPRGRRRGRRPSRR